MRWRHDTMKTAMDLWLVEGRVIQKDKKTLEKKEVKYNKKIARLEEKLESSRSNTRKYKGEYLTAKKERDYYIKKKEELEKERDDFKALTKFQKIKAIMKNEV